MNFSPFAHYVWVEISILLCIWNVCGIANDDDAAAASATATISTADDNNNEKKKKKRFQGLLYCSYTNEPKLKKEEKNRKIKNKPTQSQLNEINEKKKKQDTNAHSKQLE